MMSADLSWYERSKQWLEGPVPTWIAIGGYVMLTRIGILLERVIVELRKTKGAD